jgi:hypothetical protein
MRPRRAAIVLIVTLATLGVAMRRPAAAGQLPAPQIGARDASRPAPPPLGSGLIAGALVAVETGKPVRQARVTLTGGETKMSRTVISDDQGAFSFVDLPAGSFTLSASRPGYLDSVYGQRRPGNGKSGVPIQLTAGQKLDRISLQIPKGGVLTGTVIDDFGDPAYNTQVRAMRYVLRGGVRSLQQAGSSMTDDRGMYRIPALPPGEYLVMALPRDMGLSAMQEEVKARLFAVAQAAKARGASADTVIIDTKLQLEASGSNNAADSKTTYAPVYYTGTTQPGSATPVALDIGQERAGIDLQLQVLPAVSLSGGVSSDAPLAPGAVVHLIDASFPVPGLGFRTTNVNPDGRFIFSGVSPGQYTLIARAGGKAAADSAFMEGYRVALAKNDAAPAKIDEMVRLMAGESYWAMSDVSVGTTNLADVSLILQRGMTVSGTVALDGANAANVDLTRLRVTLLPVSDSASTTDILSTREAQVDATGRFTLRGAMPGRYRIGSVIGAPSGYQLESAMFNGRDALDLPLEIKPGEDQAGGVLTLSTKTSDLVGTLQDASGRPVSDYTLIAFPADARLWIPSARRIQATRPGSDGRYLLSNLPAGEYRLVAVNDPDPGQWYDPAFLREIAPVAMSVTLAKGERKTQDVRVAVSK